MAVRDVVNPTAITADLAPDAATVNESDADAAFEEEPQRLRLDVLSGGDGDVQRRDAVGGGHSSTSHAMPAADAQPTAPEVRACQAREFRRPALSGTVRVAYTGRYGRR